MVLNKTVQIKGYGLDRNNRVLGVASADGTHVKLQMVKAGLSEVYRGKHPRLLNTKIYKDAEEEAKKTKRGMWAQSDKYISPKEWRKMR